MTTEQKIQKLEKEVAELKSVVLSLIPLDKEGEYKDSFLPGLKKAEKSDRVGTFS